MRTNAADLYEFNILFETKGFDESEMDLENDVAASRRTWQDAQHQRLWFAATSSAPAASDLSHR